MTRADHIADFSLVPLGIAVALCLWRASDTRLARYGFRFLVSLLVIATSLAVALSLGIPLPRRPRQTRVWPRLALGGSSNPPDARVGSRGSPPSV